MVKQQLVEYAVQELNKQVPQDRIKEILHMSGWMDDDIADSLQAAWETIQADTPDPTAA